MDNTHTATQETSTTADQKPKQKKKANNGRAIIRCFALSPATFQYLKAYQNKTEAQGQERPNNNTALALILKEHSEFTAAKEGA